MGSHSTLLFKSIMALEKSTLTLVSYLKYSVEQRDVALSTLRPVLHTFVKTQYMCAFVILLWTSKLSRGHTPHSVSDSGNQQQRPLKFFSELLQPDVNSAMSCGILTHESYSSLLPHAHDHAALCSFTTGARGVSFLLHLLFLIIIPKI